eukprot:scaffold36712_cov39-Tisochrysis_lutea.AAC.1
MAAYMHATRRSIDSTGTAYGAMLPMWPCPGSGLTKPHITDRLASRSVMLPLALVLGDKSVSLCLYLCVQAGAAILQPHAMLPSLSDVLLDVSCARLMAHRDRSTMHDATHNVTMCTKTNKLPQC